MPVMDTSDSSEPSAQESLTFNKTGSFQFEHQVGSASMSPSCRDVVCASNNGLYIIDLDNPYAPPYLLKYQTTGVVAEVQWCQHAARQTSVISTIGDTAVVWDVDAPHKPIVQRLYAHNRIITDMNWSNFNHEILATCGTDTNIFIWDLRNTRLPQGKASAWHSGATQVKWNRKQQHILASSHDRSLYIWDDRKLSKPLKTLNAHRTKIYGIDWSPEHSASIITCSLDKTIKFWDISRQEGEPLNRVLHTTYPVWRARHTPFGHGLLAMPQSRDNKIHLYDRRTYRISDRESMPKPVESFEGHSRPVKEFLWRTRGSVQHGYDCRDFQLVSWGSDKKLCLHRLSQDTLKKVGWSKGEIFLKDTQGRSLKQPLLQFQHDRVVYKSYRRDEDSSQPTMRFTFPDEMYSTSDRPPQTQVDDSGRDNLFRLQGLPSKAEWDRGLYPRQRKGNQDALKWMRSVKLSREDDPRQRRNPDPYASPEFFGTESLKDEITFVADKYPEIHFLEASVNERIVKIELEGPWADDEKETNVRVRIYFPHDYPESSPPILNLDHSGGTTEPFHRRLTSSVQSIAKAYTKLHKGSFEALILYLTGEQTLEEALKLHEAPSEISIFSFDGNNDYSHSSPSLDYANWSDDDDDAALGTLSKSGNLDGSNTDFTDSKNTSVPIPATCGGRFAPNGQLACFFLKKKVVKDRTPEERSIDYSGVGESLQAFKELASQRTRLQPESESSRSSSPLSFTVSTSIMPTKSGLHDPNPQISYRNGKWPSYYHLRSDWIYDPPGANANSSSAKEPPAYASLVNIEPILPVNKILAQEYIVTGRPVDICRHNHNVCKKHGFDDLANAWNLAALITDEVVPLELIYNGIDPPLLTTAERAMVLVTKRDALGNSSRQLKFDEPPAVRNPYTRGRVKWGNHPFGRQLVDRLFNHFKDLRDVQMLAMLSCVFAMEPVEYQKTPPAPRVQPLQLPIDSDSDEDLPPQLQRGSKPTFKGAVVTFKNQDKFDDAGHPHSPLLSEEDKTYHRAWRLHYAEHLLSWELHHARATILNFNGLIPAGMQVETTNVAGGSKASRCVLCLTSLERMSLACLTCGCEVHADCMKQWQDKRGDDDIDDGLCPNGCQVQAPNIA